MSGGSSSGSAVAVAKGLCAFSLGTDTAGSGRVPAAFNGLVGVKPTRGLLSTTGVVPACRSLDCVSIFAASAADAGVVWRWRRASTKPTRTRDGPHLALAPRLAGRHVQVRRAGARRRSNSSATGKRRGSSSRRSRGSKSSAASARRSTSRRFARPVSCSTDRGSRSGSPRSASFWRADPPDVHPVVGAIIRGGAAYTAADAHRAAARLQALVREATEQWAAMDVMLLPTTGTIYTKEAVLADPVRLNTNLGYYTNFVNLMDLAAVAVPAGVRPNGLPFGVSLIGRGFSDAALITLAERLLGERREASLQAPGCIPVAVVGAHLSGQPLNHQLVDRNARLVRSCRTSGRYRLFALPETSPPKPGLLRVDAEAGPGIEIEVWAMPEDHFGSFVAAIPSPLAMGRIELDTGDWVSGFVCEPLALSRADDITSFGGWRAYLAARRG